MKQVVDFLAELSLNNNKEWFDSHKDQYLNALEVFHSFTEQLIDGIASFHKEIVHLTVKHISVRAERNQGKQAIIFTWNPEQKTNPQIITWPVVCGILPPVF